MTRSDPRKAPADEVRIREARPTDRDLLVAYNRAMAAETEGLELDPERLGAGVGAVFEDSSRGGYYVAERGGKPVGTLMVTREWSDWRNGVFWWIQSVYVTPEARGQGVFRALYQSVIERARATPGVCGLRLYVEEENAGAQACYEAVGMTRTSYQLFEADFVLGSER